MHFHFGKDGGAERFFVHLLNGFARAGVEQKTVIRRHRVWRRDIAPSVEVIERNYRDASIDRLILPWQIARTARTWQPDAYFAWMGRACGLLPKRTNCVRIARLGDYPLKLTYFKNVDVLVCNTPGIANHVKELGWDRGVACISNFTNTERVAPIDRSALNTPANAPLIVSTGRFVPRKGFHTLLEALAIAKNSYMWFIGDGEQRENLEALAQVLGVENRVRFVGWKADPRPYVAAADVFAMASSHEPLGNVILEAWAQQIPVVSTRSEGPLWFMRDRQNGLLVDINDAPGFAKAFDTIKNDSSLAKTIVEGGSRSLHEQFSEQAVVRAYQNLIMGENAQRLAA